MTSGETAYTVEDLYSFLNEKIPPSLSCDWDNDGMMAVRSPLMPLTGVLCSLDITEAVAEEAERNGCNCIVSHHPLIFRKLASLTPDTAPTVLSLLDRGIAALSFHTRLDAVEGGVNDTLLARLGLKASGRFGTDAVPIGRIADLEGGVTFAAFCNSVRNALHSPALHCVYAGSSVRRVAVLGGDGKEDWGSALAAGADTYLTGTMSYNTMLEAKAAGLNVVAAGHFFTENPVTETLAGWISDAFPGLPVRTSERGCEVFTL